MIIKESIMNNKFRDYLPLITIFAIIILFVVVRQFYTGPCLIMAMNDFMGSFFLIFGAFKVMNLHGFVEAYAMYDIIAKQSRTYAYVYPFIELSLGLAYIVGWYPFAVNVFTLVLMLVGSLGVALELGKKEPMMCACLGVVFKLPMTYVTLFEDLLMAGMAFVMLFIV